MKPYYCYTKDTGISYPKTINDLVENLANNLTNKEIPMPLDCLEPEKPYWQKRS